MDLSVLGMAVLPPLGMALGLLLWGRDRLNTRFLWPVAGGAAAVGVSVVLIRAIETVGEAAAWPTTALWFDAFVMGGLVEEFARYLLLLPTTAGYEKRSRWGFLLQAIFAAAGFAAVENFFFARSHGEAFGIAFAQQLMFVRTIIAVPAHMAFALLMAALIWRGRNSPFRFLWHLLAILAAAINHGLFDVVALGAPDSISVVAPAAVTLLYVLCIMPVLVQAREEGHTGRRLKRIRVVRRMADLNAVTLKRRTG